MSEVSNQHSRLPITSLAEAQGYIEHLEEQLEASQQALRDIIEEFRAPSAPTGYDDDDPVVVIARRALASSPASVPGPETTVLKAERPTTGSGSSPASSPPYVRPADDPHTLVAKALAPDPASERQ